jgi:hypothetical protein
MRNFDLGQEFAMYAGTAGGLLVVIVVTGGAFLLTRRFFRSVRK